MSGALRLTPALELKRAAVTDDGRIAGYGAVFGNVDADGDVILPGAFADTLAAHRSDGSTPAMLWSHDMAQPIGGWTALAEDAVGLRVEGRLALGVPRADEAAALLKSGSGLGLSIGYTIPDGGATYGRGARVLKRVELFEVSLVAVPANRRARVEIKSIRDLEHILRDAGVPKAAAARLAAGGWPALERRDAVEVEHVAELASLMRKHMDDLENMLRRIQ